MTDTAQAIEGEMSDRLIDVDVSKWGTSVLTDDEGYLDTDVLASAGESIHLLQQEGRHEVVVTSAAVSVGAAALGWQRPEDHETGRLQQAASVGNPLLAVEWGIAVGKPASLFQLTNSDLMASGGQSWENLERVSRQVLGNDDSFVLINMNDVTDIAELPHEEKEGNFHFDDNDMLSAIWTAILLRMQGIGHVTLNIMTDKAGVLDSSDKVIDALDANDILFKSGSFIRDDPLKKNGNGGMGTKLPAALLAAISGAEVVVGPGREKDALRRMIAGEIGTRIIATADDRDFVAKYMKTLTRHQREVFQLL